MIITVEELISKLKQMPLDAPVYVESKVGPCPLDRVRLCKMGYVKPFPEVGNPGSPGYDAVVIE